MSFGLSPADVLAALNMTKHIWETYIKKTERAGKSLQLLLSSLATAAWVFDGSKGFCQ